MDDKLTYEKALHNFIETRSCLNCNYHEECDYFTACPCDIWERVLKEAIEKAKRYDELSKEEE